MEIGYEMVSHCLRKDIGCVGAKLLYSNDTIQHAGVFTGVPSMQHMDIETVLEIHRDILDDAPHNSSALLRQHAILVKESLTR